MAITVEVLHTKLLLEKILKFTLVSQREQLGRQTFEESLVQYVSSVKILEKVI